MTKPMLTTMLASLLVAACGGGDDISAPKDAAVDASLDAVALCNPLSPPGQQGCAAGTKCTWITVQETPTEIGKLGCVPDGTVSLGGACQTGPEGETTGFDDCRAGLICNGTCADICGFDGTAGAACAAGFACARYHRLFAAGEADPVAGACLPACNPITQRQTSGERPPCPAGEGCYLVTSETETVAVCAAAGEFPHNADVAGQAFANSCVPGAQGRRKAPTATTVQCGGLCKPVDVTSTTNMASEGGAEIAGNAIAKDNCQTAWGANPPQDGVGGESCRYWWAREPFAELSPYSNTVGWCFKHAVFQYDTNGDAEDDAPFPRCVTLTTGDVVPPIGNPFHNDAQYFWCTAFPAEGAPKLLPARQPRLDRLAPPFAN